MRSRLTEFLTFLKFLEVTDFYRSVRLQLNLRDGDNVSGGSDGGDDVAGDVGGDVGGSKIRPRPLCSVQCTVPAWVGWGSCSCCLRNLGFAVSASERTFILKMACS